MATSALQGQSALFTLPPAPIVGQEDYEETITSYHLPVQLELKEKTSEKSPLGNGMSVYKVSKVSLHLNICLKVTSSRMDLTPNLVDWKETTTSSSNFTRPQKIVD